MANAQKFEALDKDSTEIETIKKLFKNKKLKCIKYNNSFAIKFQKQTSFESFLQLSSDEKTIIITNKRDCEKKHLVL